MGVALPQQANLIVPIQWQGQTQKTTIQGAGYELSGTIGIRPYSTTATLEWMLPADQALALYNEFASGNFNGVYDYTCKIRGNIRVRLNGEYLMDETSGDKVVTFSVGVTQV